MAGAGDAKQPEMCGVSRMLGHGLGADAAVIGGELDGLRILAQSPRALESQQVGRVRDNFRAANRRDNFVLAGKRDG